MLLHRAAQRAFRERKQSQLAELQARLQLYEQGEVERSIALQNIAKRLKDENEKLREENRVLQERLAKLETAHARKVTVNGPKSSPSSQDSDGQKKRLRGPSSTPRSASPPPKRSRIDEESACDSSSDSPLTVAHLPSPASMVSTPEGTGQDHPLTGLSYDSQDHFEGAFDQVAPLAPDPQSSEPVSPFPSFGCGLCTGGGLCVCSQIITEDALPSSRMEPGLNSSPHTQSPSQPKIETSKPTISILDNLPEYKPPVPLRRRQHTRPMPPIFRVEPPSAPTCSGDPSNCLACADDSFGKAFCSAIGDSARGCGSCGDCPNKYGCEMGDKCCQVTNHRPSASGSTSISSPTPIDTSRDSTDAGMMVPTNDAWRQIKAHPNVEFADLALLADVVASRTVCPGPRFLFAPQAAPASGSNDGAAIEASYSNRQADRSPPPMLVPQEILVECGRRNMRHVHTDGVREALRLLDAKFAQ